MAEKLSVKYVDAREAAASRPGISRRALLKAVGAAAAGAAVGGGLTSAAQAQVGQPVYRPEHAASGGTLPLVPIRDKVYFPGMIFPLFVGRDRSVAAVAEAQAQDGYLLLVAQKQMNVDAPGPEDLYEIGTLAELMQVLRLPDGTIRLMVEGVARARLREYLFADPFYCVRADLLTEAKAMDIEAEGEVRAVADRFQQFVEESRNIPQEALFQVAGLREPGRLADTITPYLPVSVAAQQEILATLEPRERLRRLGAFLDGEIGR